MCTVARGHAHMCTFPVCLTAQGPVQTFDLEVSHGFPHTQCMRVRVCMGAIRQLQEDSLVKILQGMFVKDRQS